MLDYLLEPFIYNFMTKAILASTLVGGVCAFLSCFLMLKGWSLVGDALSHSVVPGVAGAYALGLPFAAGAFFTGFLAAMAMMFLKHISKLREDAIIGFVFSTFFAAGIFITSFHPTPMRDTILFGDILGIADEDLHQTAIISMISIGLLLTFWKDLKLVFFDEIQASAVGIKVGRLKLLFFTLLSACTVACLQTVGAILVISMVITPGATAYLLTNKFEHLLIISVLIGSLCSFLGAYFSYFLNGSTGPLIVCLQTLLFLIAFFFSPKYGYIKTRLQIRKLRESA